MSDLSAPILQGCYITAISVFGGVALIRYLMGYRGGNSAALPAPIDITPPQPPLSETIDATPTTKPPALPASPGISTRYYQPFDLLWLGFIFLLFFGLTAANSQASTTQAPRLNAMNLMVSIGFHLFLTLGTLGVMVFRVRPVNWLGLKWREWPWIFLIAPAAVFSIWMIMLVLQKTGFIPWMQSLGGESIQESVKLLKESSDPVVLSLMTIAAVIVAPICEEIVFRGYLYPVAKRFAGPWVGAFFSALVFSVAHGNIVAALPLFLLALILVSLYEKTGSLWAPIAAHFCFNGTTVTIQLLARAFNIPLDPGP